MKVEQLLVEEEEEDVGSESKGKTAVKDLEEEPYVKLNLNL